MGCGFTSGGQELGGTMFSAIVCKVQARKNRIETIQSLLKIKEAASPHKAKSLLYSCLLITHLASRNHPLMAS